MGSSREADPQRRFWSGAFAGESYYYGQDPGPVARRAVRYHRPLLPAGGTALDAGCGEGQDLRFLAEQGYQATGIDFTGSGAAKSERLLAEGGLRAEVIQADLRELDTHPALRGRQFDLVLAVNALQFMGADGSRALDALRDRVRPGGVIGLSLFAPHAGPSRVEQGIWLVTLDDLLARFPGWQPLEAARLWQWGYRSGTRLADAQEFVTLVAHRPRA